MKTRSATGLIDWAGNLVLLASGLWVSLYLAWSLLSAGNFFYPQLHDLIGIQDTIEEYAPQNIHKNRFDETTREQRTKLFRQILYGVNHNGAGLKTIQYSNRQGEPIDLLLRPVEIIHLNDVANLLTVFRKSATIALAVFIAMVVVFRVQRLHLSRPRTLLTVTVITLLAGTVIISLSGAKALFYQLHTIVFPPGHQWFFYYQESLMTLLMKAPDIFAWQAAMLLIVSVVVFYLLLLLTHALLGMGNRARIGA